MMDGLIGLDPRWITGKWLVVIVDLFMMFSLGSMRMELFQFASIVTIVQPPQDEEGDMNANYLPEYDC